MRWFGTVYTPLMAVVGLLLIVIALIDRNEYGDYLGPGTILAAGACIAGAVRRQPPSKD